MRATLKDIQPQSDSVLVTFQIQCTDLTEIPEGTLDVTVAKWRNARSTEANNYYQHLLREIAAALDISRDEANNLMIQRYGQYEMVDDQILMVLLEDRDWNKTNKHLEETMDTEGGKRWYRVLKGSSQLDSQGFARLLAGTVEEAKELGIETLKPYEIRAFDIQR